MALRVFRTWRAGATSLSICPTGIERSKPWVISVCPPPSANAQFLARDPHIRHDQLRQFRRGAAFGKQHADEKPERTRAPNANIVALDVNCVASDLIRGKGYRIGRDDQITTADVDDRCVLANLGSDEGARIKFLALLRQRSQMLKRKFADWQSLFRLALSHVLMIIDEALEPVKGRITAGGDSAKQDS